MSRHILTRDGAVVYDYTDPAAPIETPQPPVTQPPAVPPGNPGAVLPPLPWPEGQPTSNVLHIPPVPNGTILTYEVPALHGGTAVAFTQGPDANTQGQCTTTYSISQSPGVIIPGQGPYYLKGNPGQNYNGITINRTGSSMPYAPPDQVWYLNIQWQNPHGTPNGFSLQWAAADA